VFVSLRFWSDEMGVFWEVEIEHLDDGDAESFRIVVEIVVRNRAHGDCGIGFFVFHISRENEKEFRSNSKLFWSKSRAMLPLRIQNKKLALKLSLTWLKLEHGIR
jgi:hypothetical protein